MESKATATRFFSRSFYLFGLSFSPGFSVIHSQNQGLRYPISWSTPHSYHHTGLCQNLTLQVCLCLEATAPIITPNHSSSPTDPYDMETLYFNKESWYPQDCISAN